MINHKQSSTLERRLPHPNLHHLNLHESRRLQKPAPSPVYENFSLHALLDQLLCFPLALSGTRNISSLNWYLLAYLLRDSALPYCLTCGIQICSSSQPYCAALCCNSFATQCLWILIHQGVHTIDRSHNIKEQKQSNKLSNLPGMVTASMLSAMTSFSRLTTASEIQGTSSNH